jgi:hypothetical protein
LTKSYSYRFRYRVVNSIGASGWSPESYLYPAVTPDAPPQPTYISSSDSSITISFQRSPNDGGLPIIDYLLEVDEGDVSSDFNPVVGYSFSDDGYSTAVDATLNSMTAGLMYRFRVRAQNALGFSDFSQVLMVGLGPLPSNPSAPTKASDDASNSESSIMLNWSPLVSQTLQINFYSLYMDDGYGVNFTEIY